MPDQHDPSKYKPAAFLRAAGFIFLILGVPILILLPTAFDMPDYWEPALQLVLGGGALLLLTLLASFATPILIGHFRDWRKNKHNYAWMDLLKLTYLTFFIAILWFVIARYAIQLVKTF